MPSFIITESCGSKRAQSKKNAAYGRKHYDRKFQQSSFDKLKKQFLDSRK